MAAPKGKDGKNLSHPIFVPDKQNKFDLSKKTERFKDSPPDEVEQTIAQIKREAEYNNFKVSAIRCVRIMQGRMARVHYVKHL